MLFPKGNHVFEEFRFKLTPKGGYGTIGRNHLKVPLHESIPDSVYKVGEQPDKLSLDS